MFSEREKRLATILQRLAEWNSLPLADTPRNVLSSIVRDSEELLGELGLPAYPEQRQVSTEPASASSEETSEPNKSQPPGDH
jgi:hypothetical protein